MNVSYYIRKGRVNKQGKTVLMLDITWRGYRLQCSSTHLVAPKHFTPDGKKLVATAAENSLALNWTLGQLKLNLQREYALLSSKDGLPVEFSVLQMRELVRRLTGQHLQKKAVEQAVAVPVSPKETIWDTLSEWQVAYRRKYSESHLRKYNPVRVWLDQYCPHFHLGLLDEQWVDAYLTWLLENTDLGNAMLSIHLSFFRAMLKYKRLPYEWLTASLPSNEGEVDLHYAEVLQLYQHRYAGPELRKAADAYVFLCLVGLRYGDYLKDFGLTTVQVAGTSVPTIQLRQGKTKETVTVALPPLALAIWDSYQGRLPKYAHAHFNKLLKQVALSAGLTRLVTVTTVRGKDYTSSTHPLHELVTAHTARHTFASLLLEATGNKDLAQQGLGHSSTAATGIYARPKTTIQIQQTLAAWEKLQNP